MADNGSQPGTSAGSGNVNNYVSGCNIENFNQHNNVSSPCCAKIEIDYCPAPVATFLGRSEELEILKTLLIQDQVVALVGMGGLGKTQLSRKYVQVNKADYKYKYWLECETPKKLKNSFKKFAKKLHIESDNIDDEVVNDVYKKIEAVRTILVFDNVEKPEHVYDYLPTRVDLPSIVTIHVLITSRLTDWTCDEQIQCYKLQPFDISTSLQIFQRKIGESCIDTMQDEWKQLAEMLGYLPLALQVAISYIHKRNRHNPDLRTVLADYIKQLKEGADRLLNDPLTEYGNRSVYVSMMLTLKQLDNETGDEWEFASTLINVTAYMNPDIIEKKCLLKLLNNDDATWKLDDALIILTEYSLFNQGIDWKGDTIYTFHRIIQTSVRHNQTLTGTADTYYIRALKCTCTEDYISCNVLQYAEKRASALAHYYETDPSPKILEYLVDNKVTTAMEVILKLISENQIQIAMNEHALLYRAVGCEDLNMTQLLCKYGADINQVCRTEDREPPLHRALRGETVEIATWLLDNGAKPTVRNRARCNALHEAIRLAKHKMVPIIIKTEKAVVNETDIYGQTPLHVMYYSDNEEDILSTTRVLVESGADITAVDKNGNTVLHSVTRSACAAAVSLILQRNNVHINIKNKEGKAAVHFIPYYNTHIDDERILSTIHVLVDSGGDLTGVDMWGNTVLHSAAKCACATAVSLIAQLNKDLINIKNKGGQTALHVITYGDTDIDDERILSTMRVLVKSGGDLTKVDTEGDTVLHSASRYARAAAVSFILQLNKDLTNIKNEDGKTALHVIPYYNTCIDDERILSTIRVLVESDVDLTKVDKWGNTILYSAACAARAEAVSLILQLNKDLINIKNDLGETALHVLENGFNFKIKYEFEGEKMKLFARMKETARVLIINGLSLDTRDNKGCTPLDTVPSEYKDLLLQVAEECNNQLPMLPVNRQGTE